MFRRLKKHVPLLVTALVAGTVVAVGPTVAQAAYDAVNADKVDGKHAVGAGASLQQRKRKLVATGGNGRLPNNIISKAPDAETVDGIDSSHLLDRYTRSEVDTMPASRMLGFGAVNLDGSLGTNTYFPGGSAEKAGTGVYRLRLSGYGPGCSRTFPVVLATPEWSFGEAHTGSASMNCGTGDVSMQVNTANSAGTATDRRFTFMFLGGPAHAPSARQRAGVEVCELRPDGVRCR